MTDAFAPAHITGFFAVRSDPDPMKTGSVGCGLCLEKGVMTSIKQDTEKLVIKFNNEPIEFPTVQWVIEKLLGPEPKITVDLKCDVPLGFGFGVSGAAALSSAFAIGSAFDLEMDMTQLAEVAHVAEVVNRTGMGDVTGQCAGGMAIRSVPGAPGQGSVEKLVVESMEISWVCLGELSTASVLDNESTMQAVNKAGERALKLLKKNQSFENFMSLSKEFAVKTGLISLSAMEAVDAVEAQGGMASMAMLGDTVFALGGKDALSGFGKVDSSRISIKGARCL
ncbi:MAG: GHMP kinase [Nitrospirae bacterium]|nr:GHMP kinase [Nitrospirota bacterium]